MTIDEYVTAIIEQIEVAKDYEEVEKIIRLAITRMKERKKNGYIIQRCIDALGVSIQDQQQLEGNKNKWDHYRFALTCIGKSCVKGVTED